MRSERPKSLYKINGKWNKYCVFLVFVVVVVPFKIAIVIAACLFVAISIGFIEKLMHPHN